MTVKLHRIFTGKGIGRTHDRGQNFVKSPALNVEMAQRKLSWGKVAEGNFTFEEMLAN